MENKEILKQHINSYKNAIIEIINNNSNALVSDDLLSLIRKPPPDSMDNIKTKFLSLAKKNEMVLNTDSLDKTLDNYRNSLEKSILPLTKLRIEKLEEIINNTELNNKEVIKITKKDLNEINKEIKKVFKASLKKSYTIILNEMNSIFDKVDKEMLDSIKQEINKYLNSNYEKQLLENFDIKILVKDTILINNIKESSERYIFTLNNSRLLNKDL